MTLNVPRLDWELDKRGLHLPEQVQKRDGSVVGFDIRRIEIAVEKCYGSLKNPASTSVEQIAQAVARILAYRFGSVDLVPTVEQIQDAVESVLVSAGEYEAVKHYILYRQEHAEARETRVPNEVRETFKNDRYVIPTELQQFQFFDKYSRFNWGLMRRETWLETVQRNVDYLRQLADGRLSEDVFERIHNAMARQLVMPSMRSLAMAGQAALRNSLAIYNCSYMPVKDINVFVEAMLVSMAGCGVGYSVERQYVEQFPRIKRQTGEKMIHVVDDSTEGWAESLRFGLQEWFEGRDVEFVYDGVRPAGTVLKVKGGRASGPDPLKFVHSFCRVMIMNRQGSFLRTIDAHDMMCAVGGAAVSGGVRRTAMIALFDWDDDSMRTCKNGPRGTWPEIRENANNSAVWPDDLTQIQVIDQMMEMVRGQRGEPGIFSRSNANRNRPERRVEADFGTNPCGEINLRPFGLCNLSIAVARKGDTFASLLEKVELATVIGTIQSLATNFPGMRDDWKRNCEEERLLGVDITGQMDLGGIDEVTLAALKIHAIEINKKYAEMLGINPSASITCNKPSGNSSQFLDCSSGIHARWAPFYLRRTRVSAATPLFRVLKDAGVKLTPENGQSAETAHTWVVAWPVKAPEGSITRKDRSAIEQCNYWLLNKTYWTEHNPSVTITYQPDEILGMIDWVWMHRDLIGGMAFLPADDAKYHQAPYEEITQEQYEQTVADFPVIDFSLLYAYEKTDMTTAAQELACLAGNCDV